jgi:hypothetical protein
MYYQDNHIAVYNMNFLDNELPDESVQMVVTSPPYWGLRKYAGEQDLIWGGDNHHEHEWVENIKPATSGSKLPMPELWGSSKTQTLSATHDKQISNTCLQCGAWRGQLGLEPEPDCGRPFLKLKDDLTDKQREYVLSELKRFGFI